MTWWRTWICISDIVWLLNSFIFVFEFYPTSISLPTYSQSHTLYPPPPLPNPLWRLWSKLSNTCKLFLYLSFVCINGHYIPPWIIKNQASFASYHPIFTLDLGYTEAKSSCLFILEGGIFCLIFCVIFTSFSINVSFLISWKSYIVFIKNACHMYSNAFLDMELIKENDFCGCQIWNYLFTPPLFYKYRTIWRRWNESSCCLCLRLCI